MADAIGAVAGEASKRWMKIGHLADGAVRLTALAHVGELAQVQGSALRASLPGLVAMAAAPLRLSAVTASVTRTLRGSAQSLTDYPSRTITS